MMMMGTSWNKGKLTRMRVRTKTISSAIAPNAAVAWYVLIGTGNRVREHDLNSGDQALRKSLSEQEVVSHE